MAKKPKPKTYTWGGSSNHTISEATHKQNQEAKGYGIDLNAPVATPLSTRQAYGQAQQAADLEYKPQIQAAQGIQKAAPVWFGDYVGQVAAQQAAQQAYAQPFLATAQQGVTNAAQTAPGLDASSPQYATEQQAAQGRQAITQLGATTLAAIPTATNAYFGGLQTTAARELPQVQAQYGEKVGQLQGQRGAAVQTAYGQIRTGEQNADIARSTLNLNTNKAAADVDISRGIDPVTGRPLPADPVSASDQKTQADLDYFNKHGYYPTTGPPKSTGPTAAEKKAAEKEKAKKAADIKKATGGIRTKVTDARDAWERYAKVRNPKTTLDPVTGDPIPVMDPTTKKPVMVGATPDQLKAQLRKDGYTEAEIHVMLMLRGNKKLTPADVKRLKDQNQNIRIPREWLPGKAKPVTKNAPDGYGGSRPT